MTIREGTINVAKEAKKVRGYKKVGFAKKYCAFQVFVRAQMQDAYKAVVSSYKAIEKSHEDYMKLVNKVMIEA